MAASRLSTRASAIKVVPLRCDFEISLWSGAGYVYQATMSAEGSNSELSPR
jgi:hypothetical protein